MEHRVSRWGSTDRTRRPRMSLGECATLGITVGPACAPRLPRMLRLAGHH
jgi:hypothetical protein